MEWKLELYDTDSIIAHYCIIATTADSPAISNFPFLSMIDLLQQVGPVVFLGTCCTFSWAGIKCSIFQ